VLHELPVVFTSDRVPPGRNVRSQLRFAQRTPALRRHHRLVADHQGTDGARLRACACSAWLRGARVRFLRLGRERRRSAPLGAPHPNT